MGTLLDTIPPAIVAHSEPRPLDPGYSPGYQAAATVTGKLQLHLTPSTIVAKKPRRQGRRVLSSGALIKSQCTGQPTQKKEAKPKAPDQIQEQWKSEHEMEFIAGPLQLVFDPP